MKNREKNGNFAKGNKMRLGLKHTEETKRLIGLKSKGRKNMLGKHHTSESKAKISESIKALERFGERNPMWKGDNVGYGALHRWVENRLGRPKACQNCGENNPKKRYEWSNISKKYKRDSSDWIRLCAKCHRQYDKNIIEVKK